MPRPISPAASVFSAPFHTAALLVLLALIAPTARFDAQAPPPAAHAAARLAAESEAAAPTPPPDLPVSYTGRLFGYYRIEPSEGTALAPGHRLPAVQIGRAHV